MALVPCRECGAQISTYAETCPHCGIGKPGVAPATGSKESFDAGRSKRKPVAVGKITIFLLIIVALALLSKWYQRSVDTASIDDSIVTASIDINAAQAKKAEGDTTPRSNATQVVDRIATRNKNICSKFADTEAKKLATQNREAAVSLMFPKCIDALGKMMTDEPLEKRVFNRFIWRMNEGPIIDDKNPIYALMAYSKWRVPNCSGPDLTCAMTLQIECLAGRYKLSFVAPCATCVNRNLLVGPLDVHVSIDSPLDQPPGPQFKLRGYSDGAGVVEAPLNAEHTRALSQMRSTILVASQGRSPIYIEPRETPTAFAMLAAACN